MTPELPSSYRGGDKGVVWEKQIIENPWMMDNEPRTPLLISRRGQRGGVGKADYRESMDYG
jgi:hypothetical protein